MSETTPEDHLTILCKFLTGNKTLATSSSIRVRVNCSRASKVISELYRSLTTFVKLKSHGLLKWHYHQCTFLAQVLPGAQKRV